MNGRKFLVRNSKMLVRPSELFDKQENAAQAEACRLMREKL
jgi:hypothetical protein